ncbi:efflux RND transporter permease subunit, partial [Enterobacter hormaechei]|uniref:efflux RND transporter permease subunit n=1 Tax=Enterobacter hormaechei TaxID=158836 RepID=UPI0021E0D4F4
MTIAGAPSSNQSLNVVTLKDWKERSKSQTAIMNELNAKAKSIPEVSVQGFAFPEIDTGEQGRPIGFVISTSQDYGDLASVAGKFLEDMQKSSKFVYTNLDLKFDTAQMRIKVDREKAGTYGITMQQISRTLGSFLSAATIE